MYYSKKKDQSSQTPCHKAIQRISKVLRSSKKVTGTHRAYKSGCFFATSGQKIIVLNMELLGNFFYLCFTNQKVV